MASSIKDDKRNFQKVNMQQRPKQQHGASTETIQRSRVMSDTAKKHAVPIPTTSSSIKCSPPMFVTEIGPYDVLLGRGSQALGNVGNVRYRELVQTRKADYVTTSRRRKKDDISKQIALTVTDLGGRFLRKVEDREEAKALGVPPNQFDNAWVDATEDTVLKKIKQSLRDLDRERNDDEPITTNLPAEPNIRDGSAVVDEIDRPKRKLLESCNDEGRFVKQPRVPSSEVHGNPGTPAQSVGSSSTTGPAFALESFHETSLYNSSAPVVGGSNQLRASCGVSGALVAAKPRVNASILPRLNAGTGISHVNSLLEQELLQQQREEDTLRRLISHRRQQQLERNVMLSQRISLNPSIRLDDDLLAIQLLRQRRNAQHHNGHIHRML